MGYRGQEGRTRRCVPWASGSRHRCTHEHSAVSSAPRFNPFGSVWFRREYSYVKVALFIVAVSVAAQAGVAGSQVGAAAFIRAQLRCPALCCPSTPGKGSRVLVYGETVWPPGPQKGSQGSPGSTGKLRGPLVWSMDSSRIALVDRPSAPSLNKCVALSNWLNFSVPSFPRL